MSADALTPLRDAIARAAAQSVDGATPQVVLKAPAQPEHGDLATPVAMGLAKAAKRSPREIADEIADALGADPELDGALDEVEVAGPGFINLRLSPVWFSRSVALLVDEGEGYGAGVVQTPEKILLEMVSANPTGPLHVGHARHAAYGDSLARVLDHAGHTVEREYYTNDYGRQMRMLGASVASRYGALFGRDVPIPEDGYRGEYVTAIAETVRDEVGDRFIDQLTPLADEAEGWFAARGGELMLAAIEQELADFRVRIDRFFSETRLHESGMVDSGVEALRASGDTYEDDGALWFATSKYGDEKDRVLVRGDGQTTYLAADVAYHLEKAGRGHDRLIDVLGADHHGYIARLRAVLEAGGYDGDRLEVPLMQLVSLVEGGEAKKMSKRAGTLVTMADLISDIGVDAARFFLVQRSHETPLELDLALAREQSQENPVYYVQYAHTRAAGILRRVDGTPSNATPPDEIELAERAVMMQLTRWPDAVNEAATKRAPHRIAAYLVDLARDFHAFYHQCHVAGEPEPVQAFRVDLTVATGNVLRKGLDLLGVSAPERM